METLCEKVYDKMKIEIIVKFNNCVVISSKHTIWNYISRDMKGYYMNVGEMADFRRNRYPFKKFRNKMRKYYENSN